MGFLSDVFGGTDNSGIKAQEKSNAKAQAYIEAQSQLARGNAQSLYGQGDDARDLGINLAMALMGRSLPQQWQTYNQGMQGYENAILGRTRPYNPQMPDPQSYRMQLPDFGPSPAQLLGGVQQ
jgi:hypothetical protein